MRDLIFAGDVGGTKTALGLFRPGPEGLIPLREGVLPTAGFPSLAALAVSFLGDDAPRVASAAFGVAGPVRGGEVRAPNLPWPVADEDLRAALRLPRLALLNDLAATAWGLDLLSPGRVAVLQPGSPDSTAPRALIAAGTGLGEALLLPGGDAPLVVPTEGGHADFAPGGETEAALLRHLAQRHGHVSWERVVSGPGLASLYGFLLDTGRAAPCDRVRRRLETEDPAAVVADEGLSGADAGCAAALGLFVRAFGAEAGNLALKSLALGGVYLCGGIAPKLLPGRLESVFLDAFRAKGRLSGLMEGIPLRLVLEPRTALLGAARYGMFFAEK